MSIYLITYYLKEEEAHDCGCNDSEHEHNDDHHCECNDSEHKHDEKQDCGCTDSVHEHEHHHHHHADENLIRKIKSLGSWAHLMPTNFLLNTSISAEEILDNLKDTVNTQDMIFVSKVQSKNSACLTPAVVDWISKLESETNCK